MRAALVAAACALGMAGVCSTGQAQQPMPGGGMPPMARDSMRFGPRRFGMMRDSARMGPDTARMRMMRERVEERFGQMAQQQLGLNDQQTQQLHAAFHAHLDRRAELAQRQMAVQRAIRGQLQPGVAADRDSLTRMLDAQLRMRHEAVQQEEQLQRDLGFLTPVQRARFMQLMRTFEQRIQEIRMRGMRQGMGPGGPQQGRWGQRQRPMGGPPQ
ncbi:MAG: hypothetical protein ACHQU8_05590 [Gemmatimonadales bacterium]